MITKDILPAEIVRRHHSYLQNFEDMMSFWRELDYEETLQTLNEFLDNIEIKYLNEQEWKRSIWVNWHSKYLLDSEIKAEEVWLRMKILYSIFITADRLDSLNIDKIAFEKISYKKSNFDTYLAKLPKNELSQWKNNIREITLENADKITKPGIYTISLPTGAGKTIIGLQTSMKLAQKFSLNSVIYVLPFISIVDQNAEVAKNIYDKVQEDHHLMNAYRENEDLTNLERFVISFRYFKDPLIVTTLAKLWELIYSSNSNDSMSFHRLKDAVVILDEPQSIPPEYWQGFGETLTFLSEKLGTYFILMTATQPKIAKGVELAPKTSFPKNRHIYHISDEKKYLSDIKPLVENKSNKSSLIILNTKKEALNVYIELRNTLRNNLFFLSAWVIPSERIKRINKLKELESKNEPRNLISTQVVEAGVDLDFDYVIKDLSPFDSIIQAAGRCNRNMRNKIGEIYVMEIIDENNIHGRSYCSYVYDSISLGITKEILFKNKKFSERDVQKLLDEYYNRLSNQKFQKGPWYEIKEGNWGGYFPLIKDNLYEDIVFVDLDGTVSDILYEIEDLPHDLENLDTKKRLWKYIENYSINVSKQEMKKWDNYYNQVFLSEDQKIENKGNGIWLIKPSAIGEVYSKELGFIPYDIKEGLYG
jgi:CRISPR-associated endonuclease/helicase Cas3